MLLKLLVRHIYMFFLSIVYEVSPDPVIIFSYIESGYMIYKFLNILQIIAYSRGCTLVYRDSLNLRYSTEFRGYSCAKISIVGFILDTKN